MTGSGNFPPCDWYSFFTLWKTSARIQWSWRACPSGGSTWSFHCDQRPLLTNDPSFSIQCVVGTMKTSVFTEAASTPGACQNSELVVGSASITTSHLSLPSASRTWLLSGPMLAAVMPERMSPSILPFSAWSQIAIQDAADAGLGLQSNATCLSFFAASPNHASTVAPMNLLQLLP